VIFTAFPSMTSGIYGAMLLVATDDPVNKSLSILVTMTIVSLRSARSQATARCSLNMVQPCRLLNTSGICL
jgi:hypothetical protein